MAVTSGLFEGQAQASVRKHTIWIINNLKKSLERLIEVYVAVQPREPTHKNNNTLVKPVKENAHRDETNFTGGQAA